MPCAITWAGGCNTKDRFRTGMAGTFAGVPPSYRKRAQRAARGRVFLPAKERESERCVQVSALRL